MSEQAVLTREMIMQGTVDISEIKLSDISEFIETEQLDVALKKGIGKPAALNLVVDAIEKQLQQPPATPPEENPPAKKGGDLGADYLNRRRDTIKQEQGRAAALKIDHEEQAKRSPYLARRLKSKA